jgi:hypothetical protein
METVNNVDPLKTRDAYPSVRSTTAPRYADEANLHTRQYRRAHGYRSL